MARWVLPVLVGPSTALIRLSLLRPGLADVERGMALPDVALAEGADKVLAMDIPRSAPRS